MRRLTQVYEEIASKKENIILIEKIVFVLCSILAVALVIVYTYMSIGTGYINIIYIVSSVIYASILMSRVYGGKAFHRKFVENGIGGKQAIVLLIIPNAILICVFFAFFVALLFK